MRIIARLFLLVCLLIPSFVFAFNVNDLKGYQGIVVKTMVESDTLQKKTSKKTEIRNGEDLRKILGDEKVKFQTKYIYVGDSKIESDGFTTWYNMSPSYLKGKKVYHLYYQKNKVMNAGRVGDTLLVARKNNSELLILIAKYGTETQKELFKLLSPEQIKATQSKKAEQKSWWYRLWEFSDNKTIEEEYEIESAQLPIEAIPEKTWVRIYFTPSLDCENNIIAQINTAKTIDMAVYAITNENIVNALVKAKNRGTKVRIVTDRLQASGKGSLVPKLKDAGFSIRTNIKHKIEHNKFAIFDGKEVETGSYNWTTAASDKNSENCLFFKQPNKEYTQRFEYLWKMYE